MHKYIASHTVGLLGPFEHLEGSAFCLLGGYAEKDGYPSAVVRIRLPIRWRSDVRISAADDTVRRPVAHDDMIVPSHWQHSSYPRSLCSCVHVQDAYGAISWGRKSVVSAGTRFEVAALPHDAGLVL